MNAVWLSFDVEATGPVAGLHSMLSLGIVALDSDLNEIDGFSVNIRELDDCTWDEDTRRWWDDPAQARAWEVTVGPPRAEPYDTLASII